LLFQSLTFSLIADRHVQNHSISFDKLMPVFQSTPTSNHEIPFTFSGVLGFTTKAIGSILAIQGVYSMIARLWLIPLVVRRLRLGHCAPFASS
jgi:hypothetical protein